MRGTFADVYSAHTPPHTHTHTHTPTCGIHTPTHSAITVDKIRLAYFEARTDALALRVTLRVVAVINLIIFACACAQLDLANYKINAS